MVHVITPYREDKRLGVAYNNAMALLPDGDWGCITDWDVCFLLPQTIAHLNEYTRRYPDTGIFTCYGSRSHVNSTYQMLPTGCSDDSDIKNHIRIAREQTKHLYEVTEIPKHISGFLMMISKETWNKHKFVEDMKCLGVDNHFSNKILAAGMKILRMDGVYVNHLYRLETNVKDTTHLL